MRACGWGVGTEDDEGRLCVQELYSWVLGPMGLMREADLFKADAEDADLATDEEEQEESLGRTVQGTASTSSSWAVAVTVVVCVSVLGVCGVGCWMYRAQLRQTISGYLRVTEEDAMDLDPLAGYTDNGYEAPPDIPLSDMRSKAEE
jgi:hypothetical protein